MTYEDIIHDEEVLALLEKGNANLGVLGFTDHSKSHCALVADRAAYILKTLGYSEKEQELAKIAGFMHDIGNAVNRVGHSQSGALMAFRLLGERGMSPEEIAVVMTAIGNHDEGEGDAVSDITAALILADKSDVRRSRVRNTDMMSFDIHDRVNYSVISSSLSVDEDRTRVTLSLTIDTAISSVLSYFEIFLERMLLCKRAAGRLGVRFSLIINDQILL